MFLHTGVAVVLAFAAGFGSAKTQRTVSASDLIIPVSFAALTTWAIAVHTSGVLYFGASAAYVSSSLVGVATSTESLLIRRIGRASQAVVPLSLFVSIWVLRPPYFEVGVAFTGAIWIKHVLFDQIGIRP